MLAVQSPAHAEGLRTTWHKFEFSKSRDECKRFFGTVLFARDLPAFGNMVHSFPSATISGKRRIASSTTSAHVMQVFHLVTEDSIPV